MNERTIVAAGVGIALTLVGCASSIKLEESKMFQDCTDEFMNSPVERTFSLPAERAPSLTRDRAKLIGRWKKNVIMDTKTADGSSRLVAMYRMTYSEELEIRTDGSYVLHSEVQEIGGSWSYSGNVLILMKRGEEIRYRVTWYDDDEFLLRIEDPTRGAKAGVSAKRWYDDDGCFRNRIVYGNGMITQAVVSPEVFVRIPRALR